VTTYSIPVYSFKALTERFSALNKRAEKLGVEPMTLRTGEFFDKAVGNGASVKFVNIEVSGQVGLGWEFVARIQHTESGNIVLSAPGKEVPEEFRSTDFTRCDHCCQARRRKDTYIVSKDGEYKQVGSDCLKDFLGHNSAEFLASLYQFLRSSLEDSESAVNWSDRTFREHVTYDLVKVLKIVDKLICSEGWVSAARARAEDRSPTASWIWMFLWPQPDKASKEFVASVNSRYNKTPEEALAFVEEVIGWASMQEDTSEYMHNLRIIAREGACTNRQIGIAVSMIAAYQRHVEGKAKQAACVNEHFGTEGERVNLDLFVDKIIDIEGNYGTTLLHIMRDRDGRAFKWFCSGQGLPTNQWVKAKGTVKGHDQYKDQKQTLLTRVKQI
jgi:hypothetical protein